MLSPIPAPDIEDRIVGFFASHEKGFDAIENGLRNAIIDGLIALLAPDKSWRYTRNLLGIYTITGRVKSEERFRRKLRENEAASLGVPDFVESIYDMVGVRIVCLHPDDLFDVAENVAELLREPGAFQEAPRALQSKARRVRRGMFSMLPIDKFAAAGYKIDDPHPVGYSSIHFIAHLGEHFISHVDTSQRDSYRRLCGDLHGRRCLVEVQLRTILEEAWGEVDHWIRYESEHLREDEDLEDQFAALGAYIQAGNYHISAIRRVAARKIELLRAEDNREATPPIPEVPS